MRLTAVEAMRTLAKLRQNLPLVGKNLRLIALDALLIRENGPLVRQNGSLVREDLSLVCNSCVRHPTLPPCRLNRIVRVGAVDAGGLHRIPGNAFPDLLHVDAGGVLTAEADWSTNSVAAARSPWVRL